MKQNLYSLTASLFTKLALVTALIIGWGNTALAEDYTETLTFEGSKLPNGWDNGGTYSNVTYNAFTLCDGYIETGNNYSTYSLTSNTNRLTINLGQRIIVRAKKKTGYSSSYQKVIIRYSTSSTYNQLKEFGSSDITSDTEYVDLVYTVVNSNMASGCYLQILGQAVDISRIEIAAQLPELTSINEEVNPGEFKSSTVSSINIKYTAKEGWNTICMPIQLRTWSVNHMNSLFGSGWSAYTLSSFDNETLTFNSIASTGYINANTPLLVYAPNATGVQSDLNVTNVAVTYSESPNATVDGVTFQGTFAPKEVGTLTGNYGVTKDGRIAKAGDGASMKGYRAYLTGLPANSSVKMVVINSDTPTDIGLLQMVESTDKNVYTLSGQKVQKARKGLYIMNGKKVVVK